MDRLGKIFDAGIWLLLLLTAVAIFVPFTPEMPAGNLDPSWQMGLNQAVAQGLSFGSDINFTSGPYASIYTKLYHPSTDLRMMAGSIYLALSYVVILALVLVNAKRWWMLVLWALYAGLMFRDPLLLSFAVLADIVIFNLVSAEEGSRAPSRWASLHVAIAFAPLGFLPLIKGSALILAAATAALCFLFLMLKKHRALALVSLASPVAAMMLSWLLAGQPLALLPQYVIRMAQSSAGYTEAMATEGMFGQVIAYLAACVLILVAIFFSKARSSVAARLFLGLGFSLFLFVSFKAGFVRHDGHAVTAGTAILLAALLLPALITSNFTFPAIAVAVFSWALIDAQFIRTSIDRFGKNLVSTYAAAWDGFKSRYRDETLLKRRFDASLASLRAQSPLSLLQGTSDIYSFDQSFLIASGNTWSPRPAFQSYAAYTPGLATANSEHLLSERAPDNIFFKVQPIDWRFPSMDDGASWPMLLTGYEPKRIENGFLVLRKRQQEGARALPIKLGSADHAFGEKVELPASTGPIFVQIDIKPSVAGLMASVLYKPTQLQISLEMSNGEQRRYRIISGMTRTGFVISPLIENAEEFSRLYAEKPLRDWKRVKSLSISAAEHSLDWNRTYSLAFSQVPVIPVPEIPGLNKRHHFDAALSSQDAQTLEKCTGAIDALGHALPAAISISTSDPLRVEGWLIGSIENGSLADAVYVVLTDAKGVHHYLNTQLAMRPDVGKYFKNPRMSGSGFTTLGDISEFGGKYALGLGMNNAGKLQLCPEFKFPVTIVP
ncbi:MAG: hypothetical protein WKF61_00060 [Luteimonas sp.]